jgi:sugar (pentulose or hexulose) kinase
VEQDIDEIWNAVLEVVRCVCGRFDADQIQAIGVSSQGGAMQRMDSQGRPVGRVISWLDPRGRPFDEVAVQQWGRAWLRKHLYRGCAGLAIGQILRSREQGPPWLPGDQRLGFVGDIIVSRLCGRAAQDGTSCSLTMLYNPELREYDRDLLRRLEVSADQLPELLPSLAVAGGVLETVSAATGLPAGIPVSAAIHDQYAAALGSGAVHKGMVMIGTGTAWILLAIHDRLSAPVIDEAFVCHHVVDGKWGQILSLVNGGSSFAWALRLTGLEGAGHDEVESLLVSAVPGCGGLRCWPYLASGKVAGLPETHGGWLTGLQLQHGRAELLRSVVEGLGCELNRYLGFLRLADWPVDRIVLGGGAADSPTTAQILADITGVPLTRVSYRDTSLLGAAILARGLVEPGTSLENLADQMCPSCDSVCPGVNTSLYCEQYRRYVESLPKPEMELDS